jgi:hypothetical protein
MQTSNDKQNIKIIPHVDTSWKAFVLNPVFCLHKGPIGMDKRIPANNIHFPFAKYIRNVLSINPFSSNPNMAPKYCPASGRFSARNKTQPIITKNKV